MGSYKGGVMGNFQESDWKLFRSKLDELRERFLNKKNIELAKYLADPSKTSTEQFWNTLEEMKNIETILRQCLEGYSRSDMFLHIFAMYKHGMMADEDLQQFSDDIQQNVKSFLEIK